MDTTAGFREAPPVHAHRCGRERGEFPTPLEPSTRYPHLLAFLATTWVLSFAAPAPGAVVILKENAVEVMKRGADPVPANEGQVLVVQDKLGTGESSRAVLKMSAGWNARVDEETFVEITDGGLAALDRQMLRLDRGRAFIYSREAKGEWKIQTPAGTGTGQGTQLLVHVLPDGTTFIQVIEGELSFENAQGEVSLSAGEAGDARPGRAPRRTAAIDTRNLLQWVLYYPAVLPPEEIGLTPGERQTVAASLEAYKQGDLPGALRNYPASHQPTTAGEKLYHAAVLLASGGVDEARGRLQDLPAGHPGRRALERMMAAVLGTQLQETGASATAGEVLAESYYQQSRRDLEAARTAARRCTELAPRSGFAWTRLAELEFSFGRTDAAREALERGLALTPRNAQAHALRGYLLAAENRTREARKVFEHAVRLDPALGHGWLGLGLTKIKLGERAAGRADLQTAVTVEPTRSFFYSYHAKAIGGEEGSDLAAKDLALARQLDPRDPTPWLYSAIQDQQDYRYNHAIGELTESLRLNDNRRVYRSQFLLDQDRAVRSANLASIYHHNGMTELAVREATRAVESDYTNASAHRFLANSFDALRDPKQIGLRYETAWFNEQLLSYLLAPVGGGPLSQFISQQEYSTLLESDGPGGSLITEWREHGFFHQQASLHHTSGRWSAGLDFSYLRDSGTRPNNDNSIRELSAQIKYQLSGNDVLYSLVQGRNQRNGDLLQTYSNVPGTPGLRFQEKQEPGLWLLGWNHRWAPGVHTLFLGGRLAADQTLAVPGFVPIFLLRDPAFLQPEFLRPGPGGALEYTDPALRTAAPPPVSTNPDGSLQLSAGFRSALAPFLGRGLVTAVDLFTDRRSDLSTRREFEIYSGEIQHIWQRPRNTLILGGRWQGGEFETGTRIEFLNPALVTFATAPAALQNASTDFERRSLYGYDFFHFLPSLTLIAGAAWDRLERPDNFRSPPVNERQVMTEKVSGKAGFTFAPSRWLTVRGLYSEALGGVSFDDSVRLEPVHLSGFNQAFRTIISESLVGSVEAPEYENFGLSVEGDLPIRGWWAASFNVLDEQVERTVGAFDVMTAPVFPRGRAALPAGTPEHLDYREKVFTFGYNQLLGRELAVGAKYRFTRSELRNTFPQIPVDFNPYADDYNRADLEEVVIHAHWNSPSGWFAATEANWYSQDLHGVAGGQLKLTPPGDHFWHVMARLGFRFHRNQREISAGVLNLTDRDYQLSPLSYLTDLPRERTFFVRARFNF